MLSCPLGEVLILLDFLEKSVLVDLKNAIRSGVKFCSDEKELVEVDPELPLIAKTQLIGLTSVLLLGDTL